MRMLSRALCTMLCLTATAAVNAGVILDRPTFVGGISDAITDDYSDPGYVFFQADAVMSAVVGETDYRATGFENVNLVPTVGDNNYYCSGCNASFELSFTSTSIGNANGVFAVGFDYFNRGNPGYIASVVFGDGSTSDFALDLVGTTADISGFFGITAVEGIRSIHLGLANGESTRLGSFGIDNLTIGCDPAQANRCFGDSQEIPLPTTPALLGVGLVMLSLVRRRRGKSAGPA